MPLPCAVFLCSGLRKELFGFHNGEKYHDTYLKITAIVFGSDEWDMGKMAMTTVDVDIPDKLIQDIITKEYEPDNHFGNVVFPTDGLCGREQLKQRLK